MVSSPLFCILALLFALSTTRTSFVRAHGYVQNITIDGTTYQAWHPFDDPYVPSPPSLIARTVPDDGPVEAIDDTAIRCNKGGEKGAPLTAKVQGGSQITFTWNRWPDDHKGPVTTYMAPCGDSCQNFDGSGQNWFKIHQAGMDANGKWASDKLIANNLQWQVTIPPKLKSGQYLIRHEILALHSSGAPQFYPHCSQLSLTSSGTSAPDPSELTSFPGAYDGAGTAIYGDIYNQPTTWPIAGPDVAALAGGKGGENDPDASTNTASGSNSGSSNGNGSPATPTDSDPSETTTATGATKTPNTKPTSTPKPASTGGRKGGHCRLKNAPPAKAVARSVKRGWRSRSFRMLSRKRMH